MKLIFLFPPNYSNSRRTGVGGIKLFLDKEKHEKKEHLKSCLKPYNQQKFHVIEDFDEKNAYGGEKEWY